MYHAILTLHVTGVCLVVGTLFVQSLSVIFRLRLTQSEQIAGAQWIQERINYFIYYPILLVTMATGLYLALVQGLFTADGERWLHWKLMFVIALTLVTFYAGKLIKNFSNTAKKHPSNIYLRVFNEVPTMLMLIILGLVVFRPF